MFRKFEDLRIVCDKSLEKIRMEKYVFLMQSDTTVMNYIYKLYCFIFMLIIIAQHAVEF